MTLFRVMLWKDSI